MSGEGEFLWCSELLLSPTQCACVPDESPDVVVKNVEDFPTTLPTTPDFGLYLYSKRNLIDRFLLDKEGMEMGFSAEVESLAESLYLPLVELIPPALQFGKSLDIFWETCWRIALKFYSLDAIFNIYEDYKREGRPEYINRMELFVLGKYEWRLPLDEAHERLPSIFERQIERFDFLARSNREKVRELQAKRREDDSRKLDNELGEVQYNVLAFERLRRMRQLELELFTAGVGIQTVEAELERLKGKTQKQLRVEATRILKKRPSRAI